MDFLTGSGNAENDRRNFLKSQYIFWLLAAIDGHAKNFSIFIEQGGGFRLTPFYDIMSAYPIIQKKQLKLKKIKMAMALTGKNKHYSWETILNRHWLDTAKQCRFSQKEILNIIDEVKAQAKQVMECIEGTLPNNFPQYISDSIFKSIAKALKRT